MSGTSRLKMRLRKYGVTAVHSPGKGMNRMEVPGRFLGKCTGKMTV